MFSHYLTIVAKPSAQNKVCMLKSVILKFTVLISDDSESVVESDYSWLYEEDPSEFVRMESEESDSWVNEVDMEEG